MPATPAVIPAVITVNSVTFDKPNAAYSNVTLDISVRFGAPLSGSNYIIMTFSTEFIRMDNGALTCELVDGTTVISKACITT